MAGCRWLLLLGLASICASQAQAQGQGQGPTPLEQRALQQLGGPVVRPKETIQADVWLGVSGLAEQ